MYKNLNGVKAGVRLGMCAQLRRIEVSGGTFRGVMMQHPTQIKSWIAEAKDFIAEHPNLAPPLGIFGSVVGLATISKTLMDGFTWTYTKWGTTGVVSVVGAIVGVSLVSILLVRRAILPRPVIQGFPNPYLSRSPTIRWTYDAPNSQKVSYEVLVKQTDAGKNKKKTRFTVPQRVTHTELRDAIGNLQVTVNPVADGRRLHASAPVRTELYRDSEQRIRHTGRFRVAVHADPGEEIFCFHRDEKWQGFDIDLVNLIATRLQSELDRTIAVEYLYHNWPEVIGAPSQYEVDIAIASISISPEREKIYNVMFSDAYATSHLGIVTNGPGSRDYRGGAVTLADLAGKNVAVHKDTTAATFVEKVQADDRYRGTIDVHTAQNNDELRELLKNGAVDAVIYDYWRGYALLEPGTTVVRLQHDMDIEPEQYGLTLHKVNTSLLRTVNAILHRERPHLQNLLEERVRRREQEVNAIVAPLISTSQSGTTVPLRRAKSQRQ